MSKLQRFRHKRSQRKLLRRWLTTVHKRSYCKLLESDSFSDKNTQGETNNVSVKPQWRATIISRLFLWSGSTGSWGSGSGSPGPGRLLGHYSIALHAVRTEKVLPRARHHWNRWPLWMALITGYYGLVNSCLPESPERCLLSEKCYEFPDRGHVRLLDAMRKLPTNRRDR